MPGVRPRIPRANLFSIDVHSNAARNQVDGARGQFQRGLLRIQDAHQRAGEQVQAMVLEEFEASLQRPERHTHYLREALAAPEAVKSNIDGFVYLPEGYLENGPAATYWRGLEQGTEVHVGQPVFGFFRSLEGALSSPDPGRFRSDTSIQPSSGEVSENGPEPRRIVIRWPIEAHGYLSKGIRNWQEGAGVNFLANLYRQAFTE